MNNLIKKYALSIKENDIKSFCEKENISITEEEVNAIERIIKTDIDNILASDDPLKYVQKYRPLFSNEVFATMEKYYKKYKGFIN